MYILTQLEILYLKGQRHVGQVSIVLVDVTLGSVCMPESH